MALDYRVKCCPDGLVTDRRRRIRVLDCTIRDGGICNDWKFDVPWVKRTFDALVASGVETMEIGYRTREGVLARDRVGAWRYLDEDVLAEATAGGKGNMKLAAMIDCGKADPQDISETYDFFTKIKLYDREGGIEASGIDELLRILKQQGDLDGSTELSRFYDASLIK